MPLIDTTADPHTKLDHILQAGRHDVIVRHALDAQRRDNATGEQTLELMVLCMIDNRDQLNKLLTDAYMCMPMRVIVKDKS